MHLTRERSRTSTFPPPAPLPSLRDALARRAALFGPFDLDDTPVVSRAPWQALSRATCRVTDLLSPIGH